MFISAWRLLIPSHFVVYFLLVNSWIKFTMRIRILWGNIFNYFKQLCDFSPTNVEETTALVEPKVELIEPKPEIVWIEPKPEIIWIEPKPEIIWVPPEFRSVYKEVSMWKSKVCQVLPAFLKRKRRRTANALF